MDNTVSVNIVQHISIVVVGKLSDVGVKKRVNDFSNALVNGIWRV